MGEWISVEDDRKPEEGTPVWGASVGQFPIMVCAVYSGEDDGGWVWERVINYYVVDNEWCCDSDYDDDYSWIDRWMPLPLPPKPLDIKLTTDGAISFDSK